MTRIKLEEGEWIEAHLRRVAKDYQDLSSSTVEELHQTPSSIQFSQFVASNRPLVIRRRQQHQLALTTWSNEYLLRAMGDRIIDIAVSKG